MKKIPISFKNTKEEIEIYEHIKSKLSSSIYIKELVYKDMKADKERR